MSWDGPLPGATPGDAPRGKTAVWLVQRGSSESKEPGTEGGGTDEEERLGAHATEDSPAWARAGVYSNSLVLVFGILFLASWAAQSIAGWRDVNEERPDLAVGTMAISAVFLRQRGSPESKPVGAPHDATG